MHPFRFKALSEGDQMAVERKLHQELGLGRARELGVRNLVAPGSRRPTDRRLHGAGSRHVRVSGPSRKAAW